MAGRLDISNDGLHVGRNLCGSRRTGDAHALRQPGRVGSAQPLSARLGARVLDNVRDRPIGPGRCHPPVSIAVGGPSRCRHEWRGILFRELPIMDVPKSAY
jgi:hypothetical protein